MKFAGIDPGDKGCLVILFGDSVQVFKFKSHVDYLHVLKVYTPTLTALEKIWGVPVSSAATNFNLGSHFGKCQFALELAKVSSIDVAAKTWQAKILNFKGSNKDRASKKASIDYVNKRFPLLNLKPRTIKEIDEMSGIADAVCLALYAKFIYTNGE